MNVERADAANDRDGKADEDYRRRTLGGLRVVDPTGAFAGPYATLLLAELGVEVVEVEDPGVATRTAIGCLSSVATADVIAYPKDSYTQRLVDAYATTHD